MPLENQVGPTNLLCEQHKLRRNPRKKGSNRKSKNQTTVTKSNHTCGLPIPKLLSEMVTLMLQKSIWQILKHANKDTMSTGSIMTGALVQAYIFYSDSDNRCNQDAILPCWHLKTLALAPFSLAACSSLSGETRVQHSNSVYIWSLWGVSTSYYTRTHHILLDVQSLTNRLYVVTLLIRNMEVS